MNELKHEDVMRALELHADYATDNCFECPYEKYLSKADGNCVHHLSMDALALLREKDAEIKGLVDRWSKGQDRFEKVCAEKDAEVERLKSTIKEAKRVIALLKEENEKLLNHYLYDEKMRKFAKNVAQD